MKKNPQKEINCIYTINSINYHNILSQQIEKYDNQNWKLQLFILTITVQAILEKYLY